MIYWMLTIAFLALAAIYTLYLAAGKGLASHTTAYDSHEAERGEG